MPNVPKGEVRWTEHGWVARITVGPRKRESFLMPTCKTKEAAVERCSFVATLAARLRDAGVISLPEALQLLKTAAACAPALLPGVTQVAGELIGGEFKAGPKMPTFGEFAKRWTSGELAKKHPDHIKAKDSGQDAKRLDKICAITFGLTTIGDLPLDRFQVDHAEAVMAALPEEVKRSATRRHYAQLVHRVMQLAVYPCRVIAANPLPKGFLPKIGRPPAYPYLYPGEDAQLARHKKAPLCFRVLWGFLTREGCREGEAFGLRVRDFNLEVGTVSLDENKTDDPRTWALDPGTTRALKAWVEIRNADSAEKKAKPQDYMFVDENEGPLTNDHRLAEVLRRALLDAGATRSELHQDGVNRRKLRVHDLRATFVTLSLANGRTETWVADRTGHRSSQMINRYRRAARSASELGLGPLVPLDVAIPELSSESHGGHQVADGPGMTPKIVSRDGIEPPTRGFSIPEPRGSAGGNLAAKRVRAEAV